MNCFRTAVTTALSAVRTTCEFMVVTLLVLFGLDWCFCASLLPKAVVITVLLQAGMRAGVLSFLIWSGLWRLPLDNRAQFATLAAVDALWLTGLWSSDIATTLLNHPVGGGSVLLGAAIVGLVTHLLVRVTAIKKHVQLTAMLPRALKLVDALESGQSDRLRSSVQFFGLRALAKKLLAERLTYTEQLLVGARVDERLNAEGGLARSQRRIELAMIREVFLVVLETIDASMNRVVRLE